MTDEPPDSHSDLDKLGHKIDAARKDIAPEGPAPQASGLGIAFRLATELVAAVVVGVGIGWLLDAWLKTGPAFLLIFFALGVAAGFFNVIRAAREMEAKRKR
jgi:ATP synthase protein I